MSKRRPENGNLREEIVESIYFPNEDETEDSIDKDSLYRTRDMSTAAFLMARDFPLKGFHKIRLINDSNGRISRVIGFSFEGSTARRTALIQYVVSNSQKLNVNARAFDEAKRNIRNIIANF